MIRYAFDSSIEPNESQNGCVDNPIFEEKMKKFVIPKN